MQKNRSAVLFCLLVSLFGCDLHHDHKWPASTEHIAREAYAHDFKLTHYKTSTFTLTAFEKLSKNSTDLIHVYIEGDGNSWKSRYVLSKNPTPKQPLALQLAIKDTHPNVIYLARPCQYTPHKLDPFCEAKYWSSHRYAPEVIESFNQALDRIKLTTNQNEFYLIGFSGGASIAALIASKRKDIQCLITIAGDLNHQKLSQHHNTTPLTGSLNPIAFAANLATVAQLHLTGEQDKTVPPWIAKQFASTVNNPACVTVHTFANVKHHHGWLEHTEEIAQFACHC